MFKTFPIVLDITKHQLNDMFQVNSNDLNTVRLNLSIKSGLDIFDLTGKIVRIAIKKPDGFIAFQTGGVTDPSNGLCEFILDRQAYLVEGKHEAEVMIYQDDSTVIVTERFYYKVNRAIANDKTLISTNHLPAINQAIIAGEQLKDIDIPEFVEAANSAYETIEEAETQGLYAKGQGDYAKQEADRAAARVTELNGVDAVQFHNKLTNISIDVKEDFDAKGDGVANDTTVIQAAINSLGSKGGTVYFPAGVYMVDTIDAIAGIRNNGGLLIQNPVNILLHKNAVIQARLASATQGNTIFNIRNTNNVTIDGGTIIGDRLLQPSGASTQSMNGVLIANSQDVTIKNSVIKNVWGDGLAIWHDTLASKNIQIENVTVQNSRRNNFTVGAVDGLTIKKSNFNDANGGLPMAGIDIEPDGVQGMAQNVLIDGCTFRGNVTADIIFGGGNSCRNITVTNNNLTNSINIPPASGQKVDNVVISNNIIELPDGSINSGVALLRVNNCVISKNVISGKTMTGNGINIKDNVTKLVVSDNVIYKVKNGVYVGSNIPGISTVKVVNNIIEDVERHLYILSSSSYFDLKGNTFTKGTTGSHVILTNSTIEGNKFNNMNYTAIAVFLINSIVSKNQFDNCGILDKTKAMLDLYQAENCLIDGNMFQSDTITQPPIYENAVATLPSVISNNFARYRTSNLGIIKAGTILLNNFTASEIETVIKSLDGSRWKLTIGNDGAITTTKL